MAAIELYEAMRTLRAVRRLRPDPIPDDVLHRVLEAATWAPTGGNRQAWRVIVVKDPVRKQRLGELYKKVATPFMQSYAERFAALPEGERVKAEKMLRSGLYLAEHFGEAPVLCIFCFHPDGLAVTDAKLDRGCGPDRLSSTARARSDLTTPGRGNGVCGLVGAAVRVAKQWRALPTLITLRTGLSKRDRRVF
jgi:nitroreductase